MCNYFSFVSNIQGKFFYFTQEDRLKLLKDNPQRFEFDSHTSICKYYNLPEDKCNKFEYNPFTGEFVIDKISNDKDNSESAKKWVSALFKTKEYSYISSAKKEVDRIRKIEWFKPLSPDKKKLDVKVKSILKAFNVNISFELEINSLETSAARSAADSAAWLAARSAADSAAWLAADSAAFEISKDVNTQYNQNPFKLIMDLWEQGYYVCGLVDKKFIVYYTPKKVN